MNTALAHGHDIQGRRKSARREDGTIWTYEYNSRSEVTGAEKRQSNSDLVPGLNFGYNYDGLGNRLSARKGQPALVTTYTPDAMNRYSTIESPGADDILIRSATAVEVEVDEEPVAVTSSGNFRGARITATNTTSPAFPEISITGDNNFSESGNRWIPKAEFSPTYDDDGNLANDGRWIYTWDAMNRLVGMTPTTAALTAGVPNQTLTFAYDHLNRRIAKRVTSASGQGTTIRDWRYLYEGWNVVAQFTADSNNTLTPDATYLWSLDLSGSFHGAGGVGGLHSVNLFSGGATETLCLASYDANGNIIAWSDTTGRVLQRQDYDPFGNRVIRERLAISADLSERLEYGFSTKPLDAETGLIYYIRRYYNPRDGRWMSRDPINEDCGINLYCFLSNNGVQSLDVLGLVDLVFYTRIEEKLLTAEDGRQRKSMDLVIKPMSEMFAKELGVAPIPVKSIGEILKILEGHKANQTNIESVTIVAHGGWVSSDFAPKWIGLPPGIEFPLGPGINFSDPEDFGQYREHLLWFAPADYWERVRASVSKSTVLFHLGCDGAAGPMAGRMRSISERTGLTVVAYPSVVGTEVRFLDGVNPVFVGLTVVPKAVIEKGDPLDERAQDTIKRLMEKVEAIKTQHKD